MFCRRRRIKLYADCTEWYSYAGSHLIKHILGEIDTWLRMKVLHPKMDGMIAISKFLTDYYKDKLPTVCVPPLVDLADSKWCEIKTENKSVIQIVYAGSPGKNKDKLNYVIEALSQVNDIKFQFKIIGIDEKQYLEYYPEHQKLISELKDKVIFLGRLSHQRTLDHIKIADFSMFVRDVNRVTMAGFPTKFVESISCGTPVITNKTSDLDEYLEEGKNGFWLTHNIATSLNLIFKIDRENINRLKIDMDRSLFDYRGFVEQLRTILK